MPFDFPATHAVPNEQEPEVVNILQLLRHRQHLVETLGNPEVPRILDDELFVQSPLSRFFLIDEDNPPDTVGIVPLFNKSISGFEIVYVKECREGHTITDPEIHSNGEYSIETVIRKREE